MNVNATLLEKSYNHIALFMNLNVKSQKRIDDAIKAEFVRQSLSKKRNYSELRKTYNPMGAEIPNNNTGTMWGELNRKKITFQENPMAWDRITTVARFVKGKRIRILDVGFGQGMLEDIINFNNVDSELWGIDIASSTIADAKKKYKNSSWNFIQGSISDLKLPINYFDYITALEIFEHIEPHKIFEILKKINIALKRGGKLIVSVPLNEGLEKMLHNGENPNAHTRIYSPDLIMAELKISGFKLIFHKLLFAFGRNYYLKSFICRIVPGIKMPNNIIVLAEKK